MAKKAKNKVKGKASKSPALPFEMGTIESDDEVAASESDASGDEAENADNAADASEDGASPHGGFVFDDESAYGGTLGKSYGASAGPSWDFTTAMKVLADQGAKKPFVLLTEEHIAKQRDVAKKRIAKSRQDARKKQTGAAVTTVAVAKKAASVAAEEGGTSSEAGEEAEEDSEGSGDEENNEDDEDEEGDDDEEEEDDEEEGEEEDEVSDDEEAEDSEDELGPAAEDEVKALGVTPAEAAAKLRADKKRQREQASSGGGSDDGEEEASSAEEEAAEANAAGAAAARKAQAAEPDEPKRRGVTVDDDAAAAAFFDANSSFLQAGSGPGGGGSGSNNDVFFSQLNLSRPLMRGVEAMGFVKPTPIQARVVPVALAGRDVCGSAVTGSGKTAAFLLPALERLLYRPAGVAATRVRAGCCAHTRRKYKILSLCRLAH